MQYEAVGQHEEISMKHPPCSVVAAATAILAVVLAIGGCSTEGDAGKASDTAATASNGDAAMLLKQATDAMRKVTGMHVRLAVTGDVPNLRVTQARRRYLQHTADGCHR